MEITNLKYFYEVAKIEHVTRASENLHIAQPALTKSIKLLENELGVQLFVRVGRRIKLTKYGHFLFEKISPIIDELDQLPFNVQNMIESNKNTISLTVLSASTIITDIIIKFKKQHPNVIFKMSQKDDCVDSDIIITTNTAKPDKLLDIKNRAIFEEQIFIAIPTDNLFAKYDKIDLADLRNSNFIALSGSRRFRPLCDTFCSYAGFKPNIVFESDSLISVKNLISAGIGVSFWPEFSWGKINSDKIKLIQLNNPRCFREIIIYQRQSNSFSLVDEFYSFLVNELKSY